MRIQGRDQVAFAKGTFLGCRAVPHTGVAVGAAEGVRGQGAASRRLRGRPPGGASRTRGPPMSLSLLGRGAPDPPISRPQPSRVGRSGHFSAARSRRPVGSNLERLARSPRARPAAPEVERSLLPALFIFQHAQPGAARRSVSRSVPARVRAPPYSMAAPRGPHSLAPAPPPRRAPDSARRAGQVGARGASLRAGLGGAERGGEGARTRGARGGGRGSARRCLRSRFRA